MQLTRPSLSSALACLALATALGSPFVAPERASAGVPQSPAGWSREAVIQNAQRWVYQQVPYSQTSWYRGYRQDCSGFVSMAWNLHASYPTGMFYLIAKPIPKGALLPGDVLLNSSSMGAHVVLFERWSGSGQRYYIGYEQLSSTNRPVRRLIPYPYSRNASLYQPYRFTGLPQKPADPAPPAAPAPSPVAAKKVPDVAVVAAHVPGGFPFAWRFVFVLSLAAAGGLAWGMSGRFLS